MPRSLTQEIWTPRCPQTQFHTQNIYQIINLVGRLDNLGDSELFLAVCSQMMVFMSVKSDTNLQIEAINRIYEA